MNDLANSADRNVYVPSQLDLADSGRFHEPFEEILAR